MIIYVTSRLHKSDVAWNVPQTFVNRRHSLNLKFCFKVIFSFVRRKHIRHKLLFQVFYICDSKYVWRGTLSKFNLKSLTQTCHPLGLQPRLWRLWSKEFLIASSSILFFFLNYHVDVPYFAHSADWIIFSVNCVAQMEDLNDVCKVLVERLWVL